MGILYKSSMKISDTRRLIEKNIYVHILIKERKKRDKRKKNDDERPNERTQKMKKKKKREHKMFSSS